MPVCYVEGEAFSIAHLVAKIKAGKMADAPIWTDVKTFNSKPWRDHVDCIIAGFPCQDISDAGKKVGIEGKKSGLWSEVVRIARDIRPQFLFLENVSAITVRGIDRVLADISELGMAAIWTIASAQEVGAPQKRQRWFCLAYSDNKRLQRLRNQIRTTKHTEITVAEMGQGSRPAIMEYANGLRCLHSRQQQMPAQDANETIARMDQHCWPPYPSDLEGWRQFSSQQFLAEPAIPRAPDGLPARLDRTRALGNAVVPQQAAFATRILFQLVIAPLDIK
jgi:DNA (cytosine-5)-methyltransferase 1